MSDLTVDQVKVATNMLKVRIDNLIQQFEVDTGCSVQDIFVGEQDISTLGEGKDRLFTGVHISVGVVE